MNILLIVSLLVNLINIMTICSVTTNTKMRNLGLRFIVFKEKKMARILKGIKYEIKNLSQIYYNKILVCTAEGLNVYNDLTEEERIILETVLSLCY